MLFRKPHPPVIKRNPPPTHVTAPGSLADGRIRAAMTKAPDDSHVLHVIMLVGKGGSGKTTTTVNLAISLAAVGLQVGILDLDAQGSSLAWRAVRDTKDILVGRISDDRVCAFIETKRHSLDFLFIDSGKDPSPYSAEIARASDLVVMPTRPSFLDIHATNAWAEWLAEIASPSLIVINAAPVERHIKTFDPEGRSVLQRFESPLVRDTRTAYAARTLPVWPGQISHRHGVIWALSSGQGCRTTEPDGLSAREYADLAAYMIGVLRSGQRLAS